MLHVTARMLILCGVLHSPMHITACPPNKIPPHSRRVVRSDVSLIIYGRAYMKQIFLGTSVRGIAARGENKVRRIETYIVKRGALPSIERDSY